MLIVRGFIDAKSSEDWKVLISQTIIIYLVFPLMMFFGLNKKLIKKMFGTFYTYGVLICFLFLFTDKPLGMLGFPHNCSPVILMLFFIPYASFRLRIVILSVISISFFSQITMRSNMLNILIALLILSTFYFKRIIKMRLFIQAIRKILILIPFIFVTLGMTGVFNIFQIGEVIGKMEISTENGKKDDLAVDSRTGIYLDVLLELHKEKAYIWGLGGSGKTDTHLTELTWGDFENIYKEGRRATESGMLNYAQYGGLLAVLIYLGLFIKGSYLAIHKSNNWFMVMLGIWIVYKGLFSFIEDRLMLNAFTPFLALSIGICFNQNLREMSDFEINEYIRSIFAKKNVKAAQDNKLKV